jgi:hypothetical protein
LLRFLLLTSSVSFAMLAANPPRSSAAMSVFLQDEPFRRSGRIHGEVSHTDSDAVRGDGLRRRRSGGLRVQALHVPSLPLGARYGLAVLRRPMAVLPNTRQLTDIIRLSRAEESY